MSTSAQAFFETWQSRMHGMKDAPGGADIGRGFAGMFQALMKDGSASGGLDAKHKELIALAIGVALRCEACIYSHVEKCIKAGATPREVMDAAGVAVMMGGGPAYTQMPKVSEALIALHALPTDAASVN